MLGPRQKKLVEALKSGKFYKCTGALQKGNSYCCLGVATKLAEDDGITINYKKDGYFTEYTMEDSVRDYYKFFNNSARPKETNIEPLYSLWELNDYSKTFDDVIKAIESNPDIYFSEPV